MKGRFTKSNLILLPFFMLYLWVIVYTAWISDDAVITFRTIENFIHGYGLTYNVGERVQTYTHPLWFFIQTFFYLLTRLFDSPFGLNKLFFGNFVICLSLSLITVLFFSFRVARSVQMGIIGMMIFILSKAFIDYSTSGLENPLNHILALCFFGLFLFKKKDNFRYVSTLAFLAGLGALNRLDTILFYFPALVLVAWQSSDRVKTILSILIGFLPLILWEIFSVFYYGSPFPNTAIAKLSTGIQKVVLVKQGLYYFLNSLRMDIITLVVIVTSSVLALFSRNMRRISVAIGIGLYLCYILYIGGDFMSGRYFSLPLIVAVTLLSTVEFKSLWVYSSSLILVLVIGLLPFITMIERRPTYGTRENNLDFFDAHKIADERLVYAKRTGLLVAIRGNSPKAVYSQEEWNFSPEYPREVHIVGAMGINGYRDGPQIHVIDKNGLADPLIARMPLEDIQRWRIGHFHHLIPAGYEKTLATGENVIQDPAIALFYDKLIIVIKDPLWNWSRIVEIWNLNMGKYKYLIDDVGVES